MPWSVSEHPDERVWIVEVHGRVVKAGAELRGILLNAVKQGHLHIEVKMTNTSYIDLEGVVALLSAFTTVQVMGGSFQIFGLRADRGPTALINKFFSGKAASA